MADPEKAEVMVTSPSPSIQQTQDASNCTPRQSPDTDEKDQVAARDAAEPVDNVEGKTEKTDAVRKTTGVMGASCSGAPAVAAAMNGAVRNPSRDKQESSGRVPSADKDAQAVDETSAAMDGNSAATTSAAVVGEAAHINSPVTNEAGVAKASSALDAEAASKTLAMGAEAVTSSQESVTRDAETAGEHPPRFSGQTSENSGVRMHRDAHARVSPHDNMIVIVAAPTTMVIEASIQPPTKAKHKPLSTPSAACSTTQSGVIIEGPMPRPPKKRRRSQGSRSPGKKHPQPSSPPPAQPRPMEAATAPTVSVVSPALRQSAVVPGDAEPVGRRSKRRSAPPPERFDPSVAAHKWSTSGQAKAQSMAVGAEVGREPAKTLEQQPQHPPAGPHSPALRQAAAMPLAADAGTAKGSISPDGQTHRCEECQLTFPTLRALSVHFVRSKAHTGSPDVTVGGAKRSKKRAAPTPVPTQAKRVAKGGDAVSRVTGLPSAAKHKGKVRAAKVDLDAIGERLRSVAPLYHAVGRPSDGLECSRATPHRCHRDVRARSLLCRRHCLKFLRPPMWSMSEEQLENLTPADLEHFPLETFLQQYSAQMKAVSRGSAATAADGPTKLTSGRFCPRWWRSKWKTLKSVPKAPENGWRRHVRMRLACHRGTTSCGRHLLCVWGLLRVAKAACPPDRCGVGPYPRGNASDACPARRPQGRHHLCGRWTAPGTVGKTTGLTAKKCWQEKQQCGGGFRPKHTRRLAAAALCCAPIIAR